MLEENTGLVYRHIEYVRYGAAFIFNLQGLSVESFTAADLARDIDIRQKIHLYLDYTVALAGLTPAPLYIKTESPRLIPPVAGFWQLGK